jgi:hypothetical protein
MKEGSTPTHPAVENGYTDAINALRKPGADVSVQPNDGSTSV